MPGLNVRVRTPRAYKSPASSAICVLRGNRCCPCQCKPVAPTFHSTVPIAASGRRASDTCRSASWRAGWVGGYRRLSRKVVPIAPSARSTPVVSVAMLALDPLPPVLEPKDPCREARGLDRVVRADGRPVDVAARLGGAAGAPIGLHDHLARTLGPQPELLRP